MGGPYTLPISPGLSYTRLRLDPWPLAVVVSYSLQAEVTLSETAMSSVAM